jgi:DNA-binding phage protein
MKKTNIKDFKLTPADVKLTGETYSDFYAKYLKEHPDRLTHYKKYITQEYNKTKDMPLFLEGLKIIAKAEGKVSAIAKKAKVERTSVYRMLSRNNNPTINNLLAAVNNVGIDFSAHIMK